MHTLICSGDPGKVEVLLQEGYWMLSRMATWRLRYRAPVQLYIYASKRNFGSRGGTIIYRFTITRIEPGRENGGYRIWVDLASRHDYNTAFPMTSGQCYVG